MHEPRPAAPPPRRAAASAGAAPPLRRAARACRTLAAILLAAGGAALSAGCATVDRRAETRAFASVDYAGARQLSEMRLAEGSGSEETLDLCLAGTAALAEGDVEGAHRHFVAAYDDLEDLTATTGETLQAIVGPERSKRWKGDPHERVMNAYYTGVTDWLLGDVDNAAASFRTGLLRDADSEKGEAQSDFALLWFLLGMAQREARHEDGGAQAMAQAHSILPKNAMLDPARNQGANVVVVVDVGLGPRKVASGPHGAEVRWARPVYQTAYADVWSDGQRVGRTERAVDVYVQAVTRGRKNLDTVNEGKAVLKDAAVVGGAVIADNAGSDKTAAIGLGLILGGLLLPAEADVRAWETLPGEVHVLAAKLPPGDHVLTIVPRTADGAEVGGSRREVRVTVRDGHIAFAWARPGPVAAVSRTVP